MGGMARAVAYSPPVSCQGGPALIAIGMGGSVGRGRQRTDGVLKACMHIVELA